MTVVELGIGHCGSSINLAVYDSHRVAAGICLGISGVGIEIEAVVGIGGEYELHVARACDGDCACRRVSFDGSAGVGCACHNAESPFHAVVVDCSGIKQAVFGRICRFEFLWGGEGKHEGLRC